MVRGGHLGTEEFPHYHTQHTQRKEIMSNPFELRFKLLEMAQSYLQEQQQRNQDFVFNVWDLAKEQGNASMKLWKELQPESYTIDDIKKKASELYEFVEKK